MVRKKRYSYLMLCCKFCMLLAHANTLLSLTYRGTAKIDQNETQFNHNSAKFTVQLPRDVQHFWNKTTSTKIIALHDTVLLK